MVGNVSYNAANQLLTLNYPGANEVRGYNVLNQLTSLSAGSENLTYNYPVGTNNGKISSMYNAVSQETVTYTYDSLNRLATAAGSGWSQTYDYDPFGNLTNKMPGLSISVNQANNQIEGVNGVSYDMNGNQSVGTYDVENRLISVEGEGVQLQYAYDTQNQRIWSWDREVDGLGNAEHYLVNLYAASGQKLGEYQMSPGASNGTQVMNVTLFSSDQYFGGRRLAVMDQLGSVGNYYPWGEDKGGTSPQDTWNFATYWRDSVTGLDYAHNRYYSSQYARFMTPDPYQGTSGGPGDPDNPQSWNRYAYTEADPVNFNDPSGMSRVIPAPIPSQDCAVGVLGPGDLSCEDGGGSWFCDASQQSCGGVVSSPGSFFCQALIFSYAGSGIPLYPDCGNPAWFTPMPVGFVDCVVAIADLGRATATLARRLAENAAAGGHPDPGHLKAIQQAAQSVRDALDKVLKHCSTYAGAAAAAAAAEAALQAAAPYLAIGFAL